MKSGELVTPTLRLVRPIGYGAMGVVWEAEHVTLRTPVAVKVLQSGLERDAEMVARFELEARTTALIQSPHVVHISDFGTTAEGLPYFVMELLEGETLRARLERLGRLPLGEVARIVSHTANALSRAHQVGVVHRDVKPDNLFLIEVGGETFVKVLDFGIAKQPRPDRQDLTGTGRVMGTARYMSPEQLVSTKYVDYRTDLWALAVVAYQAITGHVPFAGETIGAQTLAVHAGKFPAPSALRPGLPEAVDAWMAQALRQEPTARFGSAREMADALDAAVRGPAREPPPSQEPAAAKAPSATTPSQGGVDRTLISAAAAWEGRLRESSTPMLKVGAGRIRLVQGNILLVGTEAIVNTTDNQLGGSGGVDAAIRRAAGPRLDAAVRAFGHCQTGGAVITGAGDMPHPTRFIIHAVGPVYDPARDHSCGVLLRSAHAESLRLAEENNIHTIAFPAISTGSFGYPLDKAAPIALGAAVDHLSRAARAVELVVFVLYTTEALKIFTSALSAIKPPR